MSGGPDVLLSAEPLFRILLLSVFPYFEVESWTVDGVAARTDFCPIGDSLSSHNGDFSEVRVDRAESVLMIDDDEIAV